MLVLMQYRCEEGMCTVPDYRVSGLSAVYRVQHTIPARHATPGKKLTDACHGGLRGVMMCLEATCQHRENI